MKAFEGADGVSQGEVAAQLGAQQCVCLLRGGTEARTHSNK